MHYMTMRKGQTSPGLPIANSTWYFTEGTKNIYSSDELAKSGKSLNINTHDVPLHCDRGTSTVNGQTPVLSVACC